MSNDGMPPPIPANAQPRIERVVGTPFQCRVCDHTVYMQVMVPMPVAQQSQIVHINTQQSPIMFEYRPSLFYCEGCSTHFHAPKLFSKRAEIREVDEDGGYDNNSEGETDGQST